MKTKNTIQVFEHQKLYYSEDGPFKEDHWRALSRYSEQTRRDNFTVLGKGIKFSNFVGVIQAGNLTIEVLPKVDNPESIAVNMGVHTGNSEKNLWRNVLIDMLKECRFLTADQSNKAFLRLGNRSLLEVYLALFLTETEKILHEGLAKKYSKRDDNQLALKGQLLFAKNLSQNLVHQERFYVHHTVYNTENIFNQILYKTICTIPKITNSSFINDKINRMIFTFPELNDIKVTDQTFRKLKYDRKTERYRDALMISKLILLHFHPDIKGGDENVTAILFDMNELWEEFVYRRLKREEKNYRIYLEPQSARQFWKPQIGYTKTIRPDMVLRYTLEEKEEIVILDTKWKVLKNLTPSDDDLKQMFVYNLMWKCKESILVYPANENSSSRGEYEYKRNYLNENHCSIRTISVLNEKQTGLNETVGSNLLESVLGKDLCDRLRL